MDITSEKITSDSVKWKYISFIAILFNVCLLVLATAISSHLMVSECPLRNVLWQTTANFLKEFFEIKVKLNVQCEDTELSVAGLL